MSVNTPDLPSQIPSNVQTETLDPARFGTVLPAAADLPLWFREDNGEYPANAEEISALLSEARAMVDRELMEAIYVMLRVRA